MAMPIDQLQVNSGAAIYYDAAFRRVLETHMGLLRNLASTQLVAIEPQLAYKYEYDFYGMLQERGVAEHLHWVILRVNDMVDPREFKAEMDRFLVPSAEVVDAIRKLHMTTATKL
ncbi:hypothetical protein D3C85_107980 [compost metagenome]